MAKCDLHIANGITLTRNFKGIRPDVSITIKDIDTKDIKDTYNIFSDIVLALMIKETFKLDEELNDMIDMGLDVYKKKVISKVNEVVENFNGMFKKE